MPVWTGGLGQEFGKQNTLQKVAHQRGGSEWDTQHNTTHTSQHITAHHSTAHHSTTQTTLDGRSKFLLAEVA